MRVLALDTSTHVGSVALLEDDRVVIEYVGDASRTHAERLPGDVIHVLDSARCSASDVDVFAVAAGPGSFTGLRIGIACLQGLAIVTGRRMVAVSLLDALAHVAAAECVAGTRVGAWIDAHRRDVFSALFVVQDGASYTLSRVREIDAPRVGRPDEILTKWGAEGRMPIVIAGDGAVLYGSLLGGVTAAVPPPPLAAVIGRLALSRARLDDTITPATVQPLYVRRADVEIAREQRGA